MKLRWNLLLATPSALAVTLAISSASQAGQTETTQELAQTNSSLITDSPTKVLDQITGLKQKLS